MHAHAIHVPLVIARTTWSDLGQDFFVALDKINSYELWYTQHRMIIPTHNRLDTNNNWLH